MSKFYLQSNFQCSRKENSTACREMDHEQIKSHPSPFFGLWNSPTLKSELKKYNFKDAAYLQLTWRMYWRIYVPLPLH